MSGQGQAGRPDGTGADGTGANGTGADGTGANETGPDETGPDDDERRLVEARVDRLLAEHPPGATDERVFWGAQFDLGLAWVGFPTDHGGLGVARGLQTLVTDRLVEAGAPVDNRRINAIGIGMGAPTLVEHGTEEQLERWLRPMFTMEELWCQLFSEPGAGSDLAGLATRATREDGRWMVHGEKVWTTLADRARWGLLLARTDPDVPKHDGLTYFVLDLHVDGVQVRPLRQITGEAEFNSVHLAGAGIPDRHRVGDVGGGWGVAMTTLNNERVAIGGSRRSRGGGAIALALDAWRHHDRDDAARRDELTRLWIEAEVLRLTSERAAEMRGRGTPGPEGSTAKLAWAELNKEITAFAVDLLGAEGMRYPDGYDSGRSDGSSLYADDPRTRFLRARANSIEGGTSEIMRNILGERVLGLPGEPRVDKDVPWRDVPRG